MIWIPYVAWIFGGLFFANADVVRHALKADAERHGTRGIVLDAASVPFVDVTAVRMLVALADELASQGVRFVIAQDIGQVRDLIVEGEPVVGDQLEIYGSLREAVEAVSAGPAT